MFLGLVNAMGFALSTNKASDLKPNFEADLPRWQLLFKNYGRVSDDFYNAQSLKFSLLSCGVAIDRLQCDKMGQFGFQYAVTLIWELPTGTFLRSMWNFGNELTKPLDSQSQELEQFQQRVWTLASQAAVLLPFGGALNSSFFEAQQRWRIIQHCP
jgi:hypothetical protein